MDAVKRVSRDVLRAMKVNTSITVVCRDGYDLDSQKNNAYATQRLIPYKFSCRTDGLVLTVTKSEREEK